MSRLEQSDRVLNFNILMGFSAVQCGVKYRDFVSDYRILCDCGLECSERFGLDIVTVMSDPMRETEGYGAKIVIPEDGIPYSPTPLISDITRWEQVVHRFNPHEGHRCEENIKAVEYYRRHVSDGRLIAGWVEGAVAECCDLRGFGDFLTDLASEDHSLLHALLSTICEQAKDYARAQVEAGADIIGIGDAASSQISPRMFREFAFPYQKAIVDAVHAAGAKTKLHICGDTTRVFDQMIETGTDIIDVDWMVDLKRCKELVGDRPTILCGNYDPVSVMLQGTPESIRERVNACCDLFPEGRYISAAGCEVPRETPPENLMAVREALAARSSR
ncbi:MAG: uroporphyrinogen decarboxylase family protein [Kiritimatiellae bacterium]|nr:uroporphyrinogen decarboxylase family protein [Kiritimatiellia bacterium]